MSVSLSDPPTQKTRAFRHDINGLRAWAVMAVVLYHFGVPGFAGGFVGVDVFFVISGFLMTAIIISGLEQGRFSLWGFYLARARRIIPALLVLCISLLVLGWFWLPSADYKILGAHAATALAFVSNLKFWREAGYFDAASHEKWLLHTWSLSVEWQFYILLPLGCLLLWHWLGRTAVKWALVAAGLLSLLLSIYVSARWPEAAFYLLPTRAWEMLAGGLVWWATRTQPMPRKMAVLAEGVGFALIIISILCFDPAMQWPGYLALVPVLGAMCVLAANRSDSWLTANFIARRVGASSYSIYLWHWPLVVALVYVNEQYNPLWIGAALLLTILLGEASLRWVENPVRKILGGLSSVLNSVLIALPVVITCIICSAIYMKNGITWRAKSDSMNKIPHLHVMPTRDNGYCFYSFNDNKSLSVSNQGLKCIIGAKNIRPKGLLFGDSFAGHYDPFLDEKKKKNGVSINSISTNWCFPSLSDSFTGPKSHKSYQQCLLNRKYLMDNLSSYEFVVLSGRWSSVFTQGYQHEVIELIRYAKSIGVKVYIMASPTQYDVNVYNRFMFSQWNGSKFNIEKYSTHADAAAKKMHSIFTSLDIKGVVTFIPRNEIFDTSDTYTIDGIKVPYSLEGVHISREGALKAADQFIKNGFNKKYFIN